MELLPKCAVCNMDFQYKGPQPFLLPCLHAVCSTCLETNTQTIHCSVCGRRHDSDKQTKRVKVTDNKKLDIEGFQFNVVENTAVIRDIFQMTVEYRPHEILCTNRDDGHQAVCWCQECAELLCEHCQTTHGEVKSIQDHQMTDLGTRDYCSLSTKCSTHCLPELIYDKCCDQLMCNECYYKSKKVHTTSTYLEYGEVCREDLRRLTKSVNEKQAHVKESISAVEDLRSSLDSDAVRLRELVQHTFSDLRISLKQRELEVLVDLDNILSTMNTHNEARRSTLEELHASCKTAKEYMAKCLNHLSPGELHDVMGDIRKAKIHCEKADVPQVHNLEPGICFSREGLHVLKSSLNVFGCFLTPRSFTWYPDEFNDPQSAKIRRLESTKDGLNRQLKEMTKKVNMLESTKDELNRQLKEMTKKVESTKNELNRQLKEMTKKVKQLEIDNSDLQRQVLTKCNLHTNAFKHFDPEGLSEGSTFCLVKKSSTRMYSARASNGKSALVVKCPKMVMDGWRMNMKLCHLDDNGAIGGVHQTANRDRFKTFLGATSTTCLTSSGLMYWEVRAHLGNERVSEGTIGLEIAMCDESKRDISATPAEQSASFAWRIIISGNPNTCQIRQYRDGSPISIYDSPRSLQIRGSLILGVIFDADERSLVLMEVTQGKKLAESKISCREAQFPMFYMYKPFRKMEVISGERLALDSAKMKFITDAVRM